MRDGNSFRVSTNYLSFLQLLPVRPSDSFVGKLLTPGSKFTSLSLVKPFPLTYPYPCWHHKCTTTFERGCVAGASWSKWQAVTCRLDLVLRFVCPRYFCLPSLMTRTFGTCSAVAFS